MVTREKMVEAFGEEALRRFDVEHLLQEGLSEANARMMSEVGLPVRADLAFSTSTEEPGPGDLVVFRTGNGEVPVLILGATPNGGAMRYFLDIPRGIVGLLSFDGEPQAEQINSSLEMFLTFLVHLRKRQTAAMDDGSEDLGRHTEELRHTWGELDPIALANAEAWWSMVLDALADRTFLTEARALLEQRRAETGATSDESTHAEPSASSGSVESPVVGGAEPGSARARFEVALGRLREDGLEIVDADRFAAEPERRGLVSVPAKLDGFFAEDGGLVEDVPMSWRDVLPSRIQSVFAGVGLVVRVPEQRPDDEDDDDLDFDAAMEALRAAAEGRTAPEEGVVTCLATDRSSDLCRIVAVLDRLRAHGYVAEPDLWPVSSGAWQQVQERTAAGEPTRAVFWITQEHTRCFDDRGDLVEDLHLQWAGDRDLIAITLADTGLAVQTPDEDWTAFLLRRPVGRQ